MKAFILTYWRRALLYALLITLILLFAGQDETHYLRSDYKAFIPATQLALIVLITVWYGVILIMLRRHIKSRKHALRAITIITVNFVIIYFFFQQTFTSICFFINRQYPVAPVAKRFIVYRDTTRGPQPDYIKSTAGDYIYPGRILDGYPIPASTKLADTITIPFTKGLLGIPYLDK